MTDRDVASSEPQQGANESVADEDGQALGAFVIAEVLGEGGSGIVYAASWKGAPIALKVLRNAATVTEKDRARFVDEATRIRKVEHPALVRVLDAGALPDGRPYLAMPRLHGETAHQRVSRGPLPMAETVAIFAALADGVAALHDAGMVHRDIKPENVFLEACGDNVPRPVLLDFGIARETDGADSTTTDAGVVRGTPAYMAPERFFGAPASVVTDIYELAVTLYVMVTGGLPWDAAAHGASGRLDPRPPRREGNPLPSALETAILCALSTRPEARPTTARDFARDVKDAFSATKDDAAPRRTSGFFAQPLPDAATTDASFVATSPRPAHKSRMIGAAVGLGAVVAIGVLALATRMVRTEEESHVVAPTDTRAVMPSPTGLPLASPSNAATPVTTTTPIAPPSYVVPPRYVLPARTRAFRTDAGSPAPDPARFYQDRK